LYDKTQAVDEDVQNWDIYKHKREPRQLCAHDRLKACVLVKILNIECDTNTLQ